MEPLKLSTKTHFRSSQESMESGLRLLSHVSVADSNAMGKDGLGGVGSA
jgi:hypothetical protein